MRINSRDNSADNLDVVINAKNKMKTERQNRKFKRRMRLIIVLLAVLTVFAAYYTSPYSSVAEIIVSGNYYLSEETIAEASGIMIGEDKFFTSSDRSIENRLLENEFIASAEVRHERGNIISIAVSEKKLAGYVLDGDAVSLYLTDGNAVELDTDKYYLIGFCPEFNDFGSDRVPELAADMDVLSQETINAISEIYPYVSSYDAGMIELLMSNGKYIFMSPNSIGVMDNYFELSKVLTDSDECLYIDELSEGVYSSACPWTVDQEESEEAGSTDGNVTE